MRLAIRIGQEAVYSICFKMSSFQLNDFIQARLYANNNWNTAVPLSEGLLSEVLIKPY